jgi:energy-coupling factor transporter transmembrane protein EcfT
VSGNRFIEIWGTGSGPLRRFAPQARLPAGIGLFVACLIPSPDRLTGFLFVTVTTMAWLIAARPPARILGRLAVFGLVFFTPFFLLTPWVETASRSMPLLQRFTDWGAVSVPFRIFSKGFASLLIFSATASSLTLSEFYQALACLPLPSSVILLVSQIVQQTELLHRESVRVSQAMAVRGAASGLRAGLLMVRHAPSAWLHGIIAKADRVSQAMELRGYGSILPEFDRQAMTRQDYLMLMIALLWPLAAVLVQLGAVK